MGLDIFGLLRYPLYMDVEFEDNKLEKMITISMTTQNFIPAEVFPPGDFLKEELEARGWSQTDFADILGRPRKTINEIILGKRSITPDMARALAEGLGTSARIWLNLETDYQLYKA